MCEGKIFKMTNLPKFVKEQIDSPSYFEEITYDDPIFPALDYFLSLYRVKGFENKLKDFLKKSIIKKNKNESIKQWASICAELGAIRLIGKELHLQIIGFDQISKKMSGNLKNCDIIAKLNGKVTYFEVKRNTKEEAQSLPEDLQNAIDSFKGPYKFTTRLINREYDSQNIPQFIKSIRKHIEEYQQQIEKQPTRSDEPPPPFSYSGIEVIFHM